MSTESAHRLALSREGALAAPCEDASRQAQTRTSRPQIEAWNWLRVVAALDTLTLHLTDAHAFGGAGLPLFLTLSVALAVKKPKPDAKRAFVGARLSRLVHPWLFWCFPLAAVEVYLGYVEHGSPLAWMEPGMLLYGPQIHLWFLPFAFVLGLLGFGLHRAFQDAALGSVVPVSVACAALLLGVGAHLPSGYPLEQWLFSLPCLPLGFALGRILALSEPSEVGRRTLFLFGAFLAVGLCAVQLDPLAEETFLRFALALGALCLTTLVTLPSGPGIRRLLPLMLGTYVLHPPIYRVLVGPTLEALHMHEHMLLRVAITFPLSLLLSALLRRTRIRRFL